ncbi:MAG TPA: hypothetical protein DCS38_00370 [Ruminococcus sp.]|nr:hypothetical protein [Ruminococcus sp.]HBN10773.1 hypothetical protein [Ruminococcus sp.]HCR73330.1 hypothetical protein [Ruminococcus sp.]
MIKLITGKKGSGKTKILIDMINDAVKSTNGDLVCIEKGDTLRRAISYKVRWCDSEYFKVEGFDAFYGFIAGMLAGNYDIKEIFIDGILKIGGADFDELGILLGKLAALTGEETTLVFTISADNSELPESVTKFIG